MELESDALYHPTTFAAVFIVKDQKNFNGEVCFGIVSQTVRSSFDSTLP